MVLDVPICDEVHKIKSLSCNEVLHLSQEEEPNQYRKYVREKALAKKTYSTGFNFLDP
tara:strand:- start:1809 stop:1982 length:174 start_codon:yes stop_codon:yes gene_type:complete